jgi:omega-amidase
MQDLRITIIQPEIHWQQIEANLADLEERIWQIRDMTHLIVLPEMFNTGFTMNVRDVSEPMNGRTFKWLKQMAAQTGAVVCGSYIIREKESYFNRLIWMQPDGHHFSYDKRHLFRMADENRFFSQGGSQLIVELNGWRILPLICYDLRFPVWSRNIFMAEKNRLNYDLVLYIANWPAARIQAWDTLLKARAIENLCYAAGVNRTGKDGNGIDYNGHSAIIDPYGMDVLRVEEEQGMFSCILSGEKLQEFREKFPAYLDSDQFFIK